MKLWNFIKYMNSKYDKAFDFVFYNKIIKVWYSLDFFDALLSKSDSALFSVLSMYGTLVKTVNV